MKTRINITIDYSLKKQLEKYNINNLSALINSLLKNHLLKIDVLKEDLKNHGYTDEESEQLITRINNPF